MEITLNRTTRTNKSTIGELFINGKFECFTLEDVERDVKIHGETAIPKGRYQVTVTFSNRFQKALPLLLKVPNFEGIRIHSGNVASNTEGCILVGSSKSADFIGNSRVTFSILFAKIKKAVLTEKVYITIV